MSLLKWHWARLVTYKVRKLCENTSSPLLKRLSPLSRKGLSVTFPCPSQHAFDQPGPPPNPPVLFVTNRRCIISRRPCRRLLSPSVKGGGRNDDEGWRERGRGGKAEAWRVSSELQSVIRKDIRRYDRRWISIHLVNPGEKGDSWDVDVFLMKRDGGEQAQEHMEQHSVSLAKPPGLWLCNPLWNILCGNLLTSVEP